MPGAGIAITLLGLLGKLIANAQLALEDWIKSWLSRRRLRAKGGVQDIS